MGGGVKRGTRSNLIFNGSRIVRVVRTIAYLKAIYRYMEKNIYRSGPALKRNLGSILLDILADILLYHCSHSTTAIWVSSLTPVL